MPTDHDQHVALWARTARVAAHVRGLQASTLEPLRVHGSGIFLIRPDEVVARVTPHTDEYEASARRATAATHALAASGFPCTRPIWPYPTLVDTAVVTFWRYYPQPARFHTAASSRRLVEALADLLRDLHSRTDPIPDLEPVQPLARLTAAVNLDDARDEPVLVAPERDYLAERMAYVESRLQAIESILGWGVIHNDAHRGNLLASHESLSPHVLTDWDGVCLGPREIDLVQEGAPGGRFTLPEAQRLAFCHRYGLDLATWSGHVALREARELHSLAAYIRLAPTKPPAATELHARLANLLGRSTHTWRPVR